MLGNKLSSAPITISYYRCYVVMLDAEFVLFFLYLQFIINLKVNDYKAQNH